MAKYRNKKFHRLSAAAVFGIIVLLAALAFLIFIGIAYLTGARNMTLTLANGVEVQYTGSVDMNGKPVAGTIFYEDGSTLKLDTQNKVYEYSDGSRYVGEVDEIYRKNGKGKIVYSNGDSYEGDFLGDGLTGKGIFRFAGGDVYEGTLVNGIKEGRGRLEFADGSVYEGGFANNRKHGEGTLVMKDGASFKGTFYYDLKEGYGEYVYANGDTYKGNFKSDMRHGEGRYEWKNGESYEGQFEDNYINGWGTYTWTDGRASYTGYFEDGKIVVVE